MNLRPHDEEYDELASDHVSVTRIARLFVPYRGRLTAVLVLIAIAAAAGVAVPFIVKRIVDDALPQKDFSMLAILALALVAIAAAEAVLSMLQVLISTRVGQEIMHNLRIKVYSHLRSLSLNFFTETRTGEIQSRIASDIGGLQALVTNTATDFVRSVAGVIMVVLAMLALDWQLALFSLTVLPCSLWLSHRVGRLRETVTFRRQQRMADMSSEVQETLSISGVILGRTMGRSRELSRHFARLSQEVADLEVKSHTVGEAQWLLIDFLLAVLPALTFLLGGWLMGKGSTVTIGTLVAMITLQEQLIWPLRQVLETGVDFRGARALFARIFEYLDKSAEIVERKEPVVLDPATVRGTVQLDHVTFGYSRDKPIIEDVCIDIPAGSHVAVVGTTGSGKSTLGYLLARLYDIKAGVIRYDGVDVRDLSFKSLTGILGVVTQETFLFHASIADNLRFAKENATQEELAEAVRIARLDEVLSNLPDGYDTIVGDRGHRLSGGERQRLALARAILRNPPVLLLDEATSALDSRTEQALTDALKMLSRDRTTITIAHRLSTVRNADQIIVLDHGRVIERGTHELLLAANGRYAELLAASAGTGSAR